VRAFPYRPSNMCPTNLLLWCLVGEMLARCRYNLLDQVNFRKPASRTSRPYDILC
jgi:hypothetical protein